MNDLVTLVHWPKPLVELIGFIASFLAVGAVGFRLRVLARVLGAAGTSADERNVLRRAEARAAALGLLGAIVSAWLFATRLPAMAERRHLAVGQLVTSDAPTMLRLGLVLAALAGFVLALRHVRPGWTLAAIGVIVGPLSGAFFGDWNGLVVPIHLLAAGLWIGTLFMLVFAGLVTVLRSALPSERRGAMAAHLVHAFSPLALVSAGVLALFGVITAWQHLHTLPALWTTIYGCTLIAKLLMVGVVLGLGAWNWRRVKPRLGSEAGAIGLERSARRELTAAAVVLLITSILVSVPSPKPPGADGPPPAPAAGP